MEDLDMRTFARRLVPALLALAALAGCASDPRYNKGVDWVVSEAAEKRRLNDAGFPQYSYE
jgi:hypothetical protein